jgi:hypothetical protein
MNLPSIPKLGPDLHAAGLAILALVCDTVILAIRGEGIFSVDLYAGLSVFVVAALTRWRLSLNVGQPQQESPVKGNEDKK